MPRKPFHTAVLYPAPMPGSITRLQWINDNTAVVEGKIIKDGYAKFFVYVPGDLEYEQPDFFINPDGSFKATAIIGREGTDYEKEFVLKAAIFNSAGERVGEIRRSVIRKPHSANDVIITDHPEKLRKTQGWDGIETWVSIQEIDAMKSDNIQFRVPGGRIVTNFRYMGYNPDEKYLSRYGRVTLYGSSCLAKALLLKGKTGEAEAILRVWASLTDDDGKVPRSANVIGDNYISPDVRTGEVAHFLGALASARLVTGSEEWDKPIRAIVLKYLPSLTEPTTGLIQGGYNGQGSDGYSVPIGYSKAAWCSSEHNFDVVQALIMSERAYKNTEFADICRNMANQIARGIGEYLWDDHEGTFNRGWRPDTGHDRARALDCSSWGALYLMKQAVIAKDNKDEVSYKKFLEKAYRSLNYAETHFKTEWHYQTPEGETGSIKGYRPYDGKIDDLRYEEESKSGQIINWKSLNDMVWSEGTLGVAKAWEEYAGLTGNQYAEKRHKELYREMLNLQKLSDGGGVLYSTRQIKGHFTMGEELAALSWLGYLTSISNRSAVKQKELLKWLPW